MSEMQSYPLSEKLYKAIKSLFKNPEEGASLLGLEPKVLPQDWYREPLDSALGPIERAKLLRKAIEEALVLMGEETEEFGNKEDLDRLRNEARGLLLALREIWLHFPEVEDSP